MSIERLNNIWPEWKVDKQLGEGSFGKVYKVIREGHGVTSTAAIKVLSIPQSDAELASMRSEGLDEMGIRSYFEGIVSDFVNEIKLMELMKGTSNIVNVEDYKVLEKTDKIGWDIFIRMELLTSLNAYFADRQFSEAEVIKLGIDICTALELCSQRKIIHRDIKPENIFVSPFGDFKVGDFGIARELEKTNDSMSQKKGTYNYMAPEVLASKRYDGTADTYSLGIVLFKLLNNNRLPFLDPHSKLINYQDRKNASERRFSGESLPAPVNASPILSRAVLIACAFEPANRFKTPTAFKNALRSVNGEQLSPVPAQLDINVSAPVQRAPKPEKNNVDKPAVKRKVPEALPRKNKKSTLKKVLSVVATFVFVYAVIVGLLILNPIGIFDGLIGDPTSDVVAALIDGDYEETMLLAEDVDNDTLHEQLSERLYALSAEFLAEEIEFAVAMMELDTIERIDVPEIEGQLNETRDYINNLNASRIAFNTAEAFYEGGNYEQSIAQYGLVILDDPNHERAREGINRASSAFRTDALESAQSYSSNNDYESAIHVLDEALLVLPDDAEIMQEINIKKTLHTEFLRPYELYREILSAYQELVDNNLFPEKSIAEWREWIDTSIGPTFMRWTPDSVHLPLLYAFHDIDGNGIPELLISHSLPNREYLLFELYTWHNGQAIFLRLHSDPSPPNAFLVHNNGVIKHTVSPNAGIMTIFHEISSDGHTLNALDSIQRSHCDTYFLRYVYDLDGNFHSHERISESEYRNTMTQFTGSGVIDIEWRIFESN